MRPVIAFVFACGCASTAEFTASDKDRVKHMLREVSADVKEHYYDPRLNGVDFDAKVASAEGEIDKAESLNGALALVADALDALGDSHTIFLAPPHPYPVFGWQLKLVGDRCLIAAVRPGSDPDVKGLYPGYQVVAINGFPVTRKTLWRINYVNRHLRPQGAIRADLRTPEGVERQTDIVAQMERVGQAPEHTWDAIQQADYRAYGQEERLVRLADGAAIIKLPALWSARPRVDEMFASVIGARALVLDLRGARGDDIAALDQVAGLLFARSVKLADRVERGKTEPMVAKPGERKPFIGILAVLVDSGSRASAEVLARVVQVEGRGIVVGDRTAGAVRESHNYAHKVGIVSPVSFGASVTAADLIMGDGKSLEHVGVVPDVIVLPSGADLAAGLDPALAKAVELVGGSITASDAGELFPVEWASQN